MRRSPPPRGGSSSGLQLRGDAITDRNLRLLAGVGDGLVGLAAPSFAQHGQDAALDDSVEEALAVADGGKRFLRRGAQGAEDVVDFGIFGAAALLQFFVQ